ncbi:dihydroxyacetone kinase subunit DhaK (plasmid) [Alicyclobacillus fastidiosus]|uniref:Dihydroxyacetone kinase subunit DhaK n=1 Tax=Alicyclobacillus fastidiosus TaxID=392011 RepID=A0ABY6ZPJ0_9BACL|nr:dihydroxyacetone kinase subunit DhaK [Alicyclobacillus fastidiosus]WAH44785.1 dihydroxyacetone kinase subunit DhaK [Alicyclobacillus fastidiosus]GMA65740.1 dihydroxyacetone kinase subunit DhaK [Alicyclobacillus fastidiosus]GMA65914.1 dihydroxyacetone kinase subunit DhaK [Alicyclobacillus fastidiosus]
MRYFINTVDNLVDEALEGLCLLSDNRQLEKVDGALAVLYPNEGRKVKIVIGGGSGHEPLFTGLVGPGMADAAVAGHVFAAPSPRAIVRTSKKVANSNEDVLFVYGNYAGDVLNFDLAQEDLEDEGIHSAAIQVTDDIASASLDDIKGRRGIAGGILVIKVLSAMADRGASLEELVQFGHKANLHTRTIGVAAEAADSVVDGTPMFEIPSDKIEVGMGIHGEKGVSQQPFMPVDELVDSLVKMLLDDFQASQTDVSRAAVLVNGLGRTTRMELLLIARQAHKRLKEHGIDIAYLNAGEFATSLNMHGFSVSVMSLDNELASAFFAPARSNGFSL